MGGMMFPSVEGVRTVGQVLHRLGAIPRPVAPEEFVDLEPIARLEEEGFFKTLLGL
jgi:hypothetical protein